MKSRKSISPYSQCRLCPRACGIDRLTTAAGACKCGADMKVNRAMPHFGEEPIISGTNGSGAIFFEGCSLGCIFCQNYPISHLMTCSDHTVSPEELAQMCLILQSNKVHNINLVTPMHYAPGVAEGLKIALDLGLNIPIIINCGGYESPEALKLLDGLVDIYLPDFKFYSDKLSYELTRARDYCERTKEALDIMFEQTGSPVIGSDNILKRGMIVRHMMIPGQLFDTKKVIDYLCTRFGNDIFISLMDQYTPMPQIMTEGSPGYLKTTLHPGHYRAAVDHLIISGQTNAFIQEGGYGTELIPDFRP